MTHEIPAKSRLVPAVPITSPRFVYRHARQTDVRATFERARAVLELSAQQLGRPKAPSREPGDCLLVPETRPLR
jgi:hypothetical protein